MIPIITGSAKAVTDNARNLGHLISLIVMGVLLTGVAVYTGHTAKRRTQRARGSSWAKWGPTVLVSMAVFFILADTVRHVLQDHKLWSEKSCRGWMGCGGSNQYVCAVSGSPCCPTGPYETVVKTNTTALTPACSGGTSDIVCTSPCDPASGTCLDVPWSISCDAGMGDHVLNDWLAKPVSPPVIPNGTNVSLTNNDMLLQLTNATYKEKWFKHLRFGCHSNEKFKCLCGMGTMFTAVFTYTGFILLFLGSLWNANLLDKIAQFRYNWQQLTA